MIGNVVDSANSSSRKVPYPDLHLPFGFVHDLLLFDVRQHGRRLVSVDPFLQLAVLLLQPLNLLRHVDNLDFAFALHKPTLGDALLKACIV